MCVCLSTHTVSIVEISFAGSNPIGSKPYLYAVAVGYKVAGNYVNKRAHKLEVDQVPAENKLRLHIMHLAGMRAKVGCYTAVVTVLLFSMCGFKHT